MSGIDRLVVGPFLFLIRASRSMAITVRTTFSRQRAGRQYPGPVGSLDQCGHHGHGHECECWYRDGQRHRGGTSQDRPAVVHADGRQEW